ncbi:MAG: hypothetical protein GEU79_01725, partial [Acidimicrobiia bacterium]|nr:hypothetical protein [Acidimicrobiia bacterium]
ADQGDTTLISVSTGEVPGDQRSSSPSVSADGRYVAFPSSATNLVEDDNNGASDVFVRDTTTGTTTRVSVDSTGLEGDLASTGPAISPNGRYVAFSSRATNLVPGDDNMSFDIFVHDRQTGTTTAASITSDGTFGDKDSVRPSISADGRFIAFRSFAANLVADDTNDTTDVFLHDTATGETTRVSVDSAGNQGDGSSFEPSITRDGRHVAFYSSASNLVPDDTNDVRDVFLHDHQTEETIRVSHDSDGIQGNDFSVSPSISANGRFIAFVSKATNLADGITNDATDVFVHDRHTGETIRVSVDSAGNEADRNSTGPTISDNGRYVAYFSFATDLVAGDDNGEKDVFVHDSVTGETTRVSVDSTGSEGNDQSENQAISGDGRFVAFQSEASNLVADDTNGEADVFVHQHLPDPTPPTTTTSTTPSTTTTTTTVPSGDADFFTDDDGHLFEDDINAIAEAGITRGCNPPDNNHYCPDNSFLRGQAAAFIRRALKVPASVSDHFTDDNNSIFQDDINAIAEAGITRGCNPPDNDHYCPDESFLRGQAAAFLRRALDVPASDTDHFTDDDTSVFEEDINAIATEGITLGCNPPDNTLFCPDDPFTRGQAAAFVRRALNVPATDTDHFVDDDSSVFQEDINAIAEAGITRGCNPPDNDRYCPDDLLTRGQAAAFMRRALLP